MILKNSLLKFLKIGGIPLLLTTVVLRQIVLVHTVGLSPWHGGGFGMFASIDRDERRVVTIQLIDCTRTTDFVLSEILANAPELLRENTYIHVSTFPTEFQLRRVGERLLSNEVQNPIAELYQANRAENCDSQLQLQAWRLVYNGDSMAYEPITDPIEVQP